MIPLAIPIAAAVIGGVGNLYQQYKAGRTYKKGASAYKSSMDEMIGKQTGEIESVLKPDAYQKFTDTAQHQSMMEQALEGFRQGAKSIRGGVARTGGTAEVAAQTASSMGDNMGRFGRSMAGAGAQWEQGTRSRYMSAMQNLFQNKMGVEGTKFNMASQHADRQSASGEAWQEAFSGLGSALAMPGMDTAFEGPFKGSGFFGKNKTW